MHVIPYIELQGAQSLNSLDCSGFILVLEMFLKKFLFFFRLVLELFLSSEFLTIRFLCYNIYGCPLFGFPLCDKILFPFCQRQP